MHEARVAYHRQYRVHKSILNLHFTTARVNEWRGDDVPAEIAQALSLLVCFDRV